MAAVTGKGDNRPTSSWTHGCLGVSLMVKGKASKAGQLEEERFELGALISKKYAISTPSFVTVEQRNATGSVNPNN